MARTSTCVTDLLGIDVPTLAGARKALDAGVDGLVVEGGEGGGFENPRDVSTMVLLPLIASQTDVPIVAAGGIIEDSVSGFRQAVERLSVHRS